MKDGKIVVATKLIENPIGCKQLVDIEYLRNSMKKYFRIITLSMYEICCNIEQSVKKIPYSIELRCHYATTRLRVNIPKVKN